MHKFSPIEFNETTLKVLNSGWIGSKVTLVFFTFTKAMLANFILCKTTLLPTMTMLICQIYIPPFQSVVFHKAYYRKQQCNNTQLKYIQVKTIDILP